MKEQRPRCLFPTRMSLAVPVKLPPTLRLAPYSLTCVVKTIVDMLPADSEDFCRRCHQFLSSGELRVGLIDGAFRRSQCIFAGRKRTLETTLTAERSRSACSQTVTKMWSR